jgi:hypothetical protein
MWMNIPVEAESFEHHHDAARKLAGDLAAVSLLFTAKEAIVNGKGASGDSYLIDFWKKRAGNWQIIARYGNRLGNRPAPPSLQLPPPGDRDPQLTQELRVFEQQLGEAAMHMDTKALERLVGAEYTLRMGVHGRRSRTKRATRPLDGKSAASKHPPLQFARFLT